MYWTQVLWSLAYSVQFSLILQNQGVYFDSVCAKEYRPITEKDIQVRELFLREDALPSLGAGTLPSSRMPGMEQKNTQPQACSSTTPRRDSGVDVTAISEGYHLNKKDLGKLHRAASTGDVAKVQWLLLLKKQEINETDKLNRTPLHLACANGYPDVVSLLVERNCNLNVCDGDSRTPLIKAVQCQQEECATILLSHGADPNVVDTRNNTALHYSALGHNTTIAAKLVEHKADIEAKNQEGYTPLLLAITEHNEEMVDFFLKNGANVNAWDNSKRTALMIAVSTEPTSIVNLILQYNIHLSFQDNDGWTAEDYALVSGIPAHRELVLQYGKRQVNQLPSANISSPDGASDTGFTLGNPALDKEVSQDGHTSILLAITENNPEMVAILLKKGADVNATDKFQRFLQAALPPPLLLLVHFIPLLSWCFQRERSLHLLKDSEGRLSGGLPKVLVSEMTVTSNLDARDFRTEVSSTESKVRS
ncbi:POTE ankyrin domain family member H-like [Gracilinanus agilis]|uniref:POTE ankyrin domain family member H-like n=1 Tax=Gracilinanus agilis TaxID=191870 RepID=UPI001CFDD49F|nr:POTE ankyrin domain family member H-like [Gracilinanus agilis]